MGAQGNFVIRKAEKKDACLVLEFIRKIAEYERMSRQVVATRELLEEFVFDRKAAEVLIGEAEGRPVAPVCKRRRAPRHRIEQDAQGFHCPLQEHERL